MDTERLISGANARLPATAAVKFAAGSDMSVDVLLTDDDQRPLCTITVGMLSALADSGGLVEFARTALAIALREREAGERTGAAKLRQQFHALLLG